MDADLCREPSPDEPIVDLLKKEARFARNLAKSLLFDDQLADDIVQQAWLTALQSPPSHKASLRGWFLTVVRNLSLKALRTRKRRDRRELASARPERTRSTADAVEREHVLRAVTDAVLGLDEPFRHTIMMRFFDDLPPREIAAHDGVPVATVQSRITRGLAKLREALDERPARDRPPFAFGLLAFADPTRFAQLTAPRSPNGHVAPNVDATPLAHTGWLAPAAAGLVALVIVTTIFVARDDAPATIEVSRRAVTPPRDPRFGAIEAELNAGERATPGPRHKVGLPPAGLDPHTTALRVLVRRQRDGAPAAGVLVRSVEWALPNPQFAAREARTDDDGYAWFTSAVPGLATLVLDRGGSCDATIVAATWNDAFLWLPVGVEVTGRATLPNGRPAPEAAIWLSGGRDDVAGRIVTTTADDGTFAIDDVAPDRSIAALARGFGPSDAVAIAQAHGATVDVTLRVRDSLDAIVGMVRADDGTPIAQARVDVESLDLRRATANATDAPLVPPASLTTAGDGSFRTGRLAPGRYVVRVRARGFAPSHTFTTANADGASALTIELARAARVVGNVRHEDGTPATAIRLAALVDGEEVSVARSADDGAFVLEDVALGSVTLRAHGAGAIVSTTRDARAGDELSWTPALRRGALVRGSLLDQRDPMRDPAPAPLVLVQVPPLPQHERTIEVDANGRFVVELAAGASTLIEVRSGDAVLPLAQRLVRDSDDDADLVVPSTAGSIAFRIAFAHGDAREVTAELTREDAPWRTLVAAPAQDRVRASIDAIPAGTVRVVLRAPHCADIVLDGVHVRAGDATNLGTLTFTPAGTLLLETTLAATAPDVTPLEIRAATDGALVFRLARVDLPRALTLAAGRYFVVDGSAAPVAVDVFADGISTFRAP